VFEVEVQVQIFCDDFQPHTKMILNASFGRSMLVKTTEKDNTSIKSMTWRRPRRRTQTHKKGVLELTSQDVLLAQHKVLPQHLAVLNQ